MTENTTPVERHDRRCERENTPAYRLTCCCAERAATRALMLEVGNASAISNETQERAAINVNVLLEDTLRSMVAGLTQRVRAEGRTPVLSTLHLVGEQDAFMESDAIKLVCLTVPEGVSPVSRFVLEVADDWMRARGLRR